MIVKDVILDILPSIWPMLVIILVILVSLRIVYLFNNKKAIVLYQELLMLVFIIYILCLFHVVTFQDINYGTNNFIPFKEIFRYDIGTNKFIKNVIGNIIMFMPYGFFASYYLKNRKLSIIIILSLIVSSTIEFVQLYIGRVFDIDDVILNVFGAIIGYIIYIIIDKTGSKLPKFFRSNAFLNILVVLIIIAMIIYGFNINIFSWYI